MTSGTVGHGGLSGRDWMTISAFLREGGVRDELSACKSQKAVADFFKARLGLHVTHGNAAAILEQEGIKLPGARQPPKVNGHANGELVQTIKIAVKDALDEWFNRN